MGPILGYQPCHKHYQPGHRLRNFRFVQTKETDDTLATIFKNLLFKNQAWQEAGKKQSKWRVAQIRDQTK